MHLAQAGQGKPIVMLHGQAAALVPLASDDPAARSPRPGALPGPTRFRLDRRAKSMLRLRTIARDVSRQGTSQLGFMFDSDGTG